MSDQIQVTRTVSASPEAIFAVLASPAKHADIDGSSMIRGLEEDPGALSAVGDSFVMNMHNDALGDYQMRNTVMSFEDGTKIGWGPELYPPGAYDDKIGDMKVGGHTYTWVLEPADGGTKVTQTYDWSAVSDEKFRGMLPMLTEEQLGESIDKVAKAAG